MACLLVSVRSAAEAVLAHQAGASIIDVKEPDAGALGMAHWEEWLRVVKALGGCVPVSVALGELSEWNGDDPATIPPHAWTGLAFRKLGLAGSGPGWKRDLSDVRNRLGHGGPPWVGVAYADWRSAGGPSPDKVLDEAEDATEVVGILLDTWSKGRPLEIDEDLIDWSRRVRRRGRFLAVAGGLDMGSIPRLDALAPDIVAVRGAACEGGDRRAAIDAGRVARLAELVSDLGRVPCRDH